nr:hypothetical protein [Tanacetum cinerariifolium]
MIDSLACKEYVTLDKSKIAMVGEIQDVVVEQLIKVSKTVEDLVMECTTVELFEKIVENAEKYCKELNCKDMHEVGHN